MSKLKTKPVLNKKLAAYSAVAGAFAGFISNADAQIVYTDVNPDQVFSNDQDSFALDLNNDSITDFVLRLGTLSAPVLNKVRIEAMGSNSVNATTGGGYVLPVALDLDDPVGNGNNWSNNNLMYMGLYFTSNSTPLVATGNFLNTSNKYLGLRFKISGQTHYGWARVDVSADADLFIIKDYAYDTIPGEQILAGDDGVLLVADPATSVQLVDDNNIGNSADLRVAFLKAANENTVDSYRIIIVKSADAAAFTIDHANILTAGKYTAVAKSGSNIVTFLPAGALDKDGDPILQNTAYKGFIHSIADGLNANVNSLSEVSNEATLIKPDAVKEKPKPKDEIVIYSSGSNIYVNLKLEGALAGIVTVYNTLGREILKKEITGKENIFTISQGQDGVYFVKTEVNGLARTQKVLVNY